MAGIGPRPMAGVHIIGAARRLVAVARAEQSPNRRQTGTTGKIIYEWVNDQVINVDSAAGRIIFARNRQVPVGHGARGPRRP